MEMTKNLVVIKIGSIEA